VCAYVFVYVCVRAWACQVIFYELYVELIFTDEVCACRADAEVC